MKKCCLYYLSLVFDEQKDSCYNRIPKLKAPEKLQLSKSNLNFLKLASNFKTIISLESNRFLILGTLEKKLFPQRQPRCNTGLWKLRDFAVV